MTQFEFCKYEMWVIQQVGCNIKGIYLLDVPGLIKIGNIINAASCESDFLLSFPLFAPR